MSRRKKLSNAENLLTLCLLWCLSEWEADIRSTLEWKYNRALKTNMYFSPPILTISYLYRLFIFYFNVSEVFHSAPFQLKSQFLFPFMSQYLCCRDLLYRRCIENCRRKSYENFAMGFVVIETFLGFFSASEVSESKIPDGDNPKYLWKLWRPSSNLSNKVIFARLWDK